MSYLEKLDRELRRAGIGTALRRRILAEIADHLTCDPAADLGEPVVIARQFADELGTSLSRRAAISAFGALAVAGVFYVAVFVTAGVAGFDYGALHARSRLLAAAGGADLVLAPQLAFVAGALAVLLALRQRRAVVVSSAEAQLLRRRAGVALAAGLATMAGIPLEVFEFSGQVAPWWQTLAYAGASIGTVAMLLALQPLLAAIRVRHSTPGRASDVFDDLGPLVPRRLRRRAWPFALSVATLVCLGVAAAGVAQSDPIDGAVRGIIDGSACLAGFALFGRFLGLRGHDARRPEEPA